MCGSLPYPSPCISNPLLALHTGHVGAEAKCLPNRCNGLSPVGFHYASCICFHSAVEYAENSAGVCVHCEADLWSCFLFLASVLSTRLHNIPPPSPDGILPCPTSILSTFDSSSQTVANNSGQSNLQAVTDFNHTVTVVAEQSCLFDDGSCMSDRRTDSCDLAVPCLPRSHGTAQDSLHHSRNSVPSSHDVAPSFISNVQPSIKLEGLARQIRLGYIQDRQDRHVVQEGVLGHQDPDRRPPRRQPRLNVVSFNSSGWSNL